MSMGNDRTPYPQGDGAGVCLLLIYTAINFAVTLVIVFGVTQKYQIGCGMVGSVYDVNGDGAENLLMIVIVKCEK